MAFRSTRNVGFAGCDRLNRQPSTQWFKELGLVSSSMWLIRVSMVVRFVALVSMMVAPWREALPILWMRVESMLGMKPTAMVFRVLI